MYVVGPRQNVDLPVPLFLCGADLPWVTRCDHLGHTLTADGLMDQDCREKRAEFIGSSAKVREMFSFAHPSKVITAIDNYCSHWYRSSILCLQSSAVESICASWRTSVKLTWNIDRACDGYFVHHVLAPSNRPLKAALLSRFHNFFLSMLDHPSWEIQVMARLSARDIRSKFGSNLNLLRVKTNLDPWISSNQLVKNKLRINETFAVPSEDLWRVDFLPKLLGNRSEAYFFNNTDEEVKQNDLIRSLIINWRKLIQLICFFT